MPDPPGTSPSWALRGRVVLPDRILADGIVTIAGAVITAVDEVGSYPPSDAVQAPMIAPGFIDIHCHGGGGATVTEPDVAALRAVSRHHLGRGTTTMLASLLSAEPAHLTHTLGTIADVVRAGGTTIAGAHLEGPFLAPDRCGAHHPAALRVPDVDLARTWLRAGDGTVRMVTLAPELPGADAVTDVLTAVGVIVALGHTSADAATFSASLANLDRPLVTHVLNGMAPLHHRDPGPAGAALDALARGATRVELIADGTHVADEMVRIIFALQPGRDGVVLVSDATAAAGMPDGDHRLGTLDVRVRDGVARTTGHRPVLAGSTRHLADVVQHSIASAGVDPLAAVTAATRTPADVLGLADRGRIAPGFVADVVLLDDDWGVQRVLHHGAWVGVPPGRNIAEPDVGG